MKNKKFTHIDERGNPAMVDVSEKSITQRTAIAEAVVKAGPEVMSRLNENEIHTKKGPVFQTAIIAGVMASKKTSDLIPLCHPIGLDDCQVSIVATAEDIRITARTAVSARTGVEMEALTAVTVAALTVYDMCKAISHDLEITGIRLMEKTGGKKDFRRQ